MNNLIKAIQAAEDYLQREETGVILTGARSMEITGQWIKVEGVRRAYHRTYVVNCASGQVFEVLGGSQMDDMDLIRSAMEAY
jgi:hypothetical protein